MNQEPWSSKGSSANANAANWTRQTKHSSARYTSTVTGECHMTPWELPGHNSRTGQIQAKFQILLPVQRNLLGRSLESETSESLGPDGNEMHKPSASLYFKSRRALFIDRPHLLTCHNIHEREPKLTLKALSLTYKCGGRVGPQETPAPVLSVNLLLQNASRSSAAPIPFMCPLDSLSADPPPKYIHTHTHKIGALADW